MKIECPCCSIAFTGKGAVGSLHYHLRTVHDLRPAQAFDEVRRLLEKKAEALLLGPDSVQRVITVRLPALLHFRLKAGAKESGQTLNRFCQLLLADECVLDAAETGEGLESAGIASAG